MLKFNKKYVINAVLVLVLLNLVLIAIMLSVKINLNSDDLSRIIDFNTYQAIFLSNDQIYFGRLKSESQKSEYLTLTDVYYVKVGEDSIGTLVKLGQIEPHRPTNEMIINRNHILFWENLSLDSPVVRTIQGYK